ncbi:pentatricopeptide repeat-containing protein At1g01970 [Impatiens glandulifera]|uniref:pentatricopeptide repeat-containing protein At1g01970 n=1 Tax=Impatiens glandulifera TaxID=253017 RepID=UPI001FB165F6|nr:pentatricopeptide repeat-containing protein At1g01970 [Impatiens glandulifera]
MVLFSAQILSLPSQICVVEHVNRVGNHSPVLKSYSLRKPTRFVSHRCISTTATTCLDEIETVKIQEEKEEVEEKRKFRWVEIGSDISEEEKLAISQLPVKMSNRCKALMKQLICFSMEKMNLSQLVAAWVKIMKPSRADWLTVLRQLEKMNHPLHFQVAELAIHEESFETNLRDYTKLIHHYAKENRIEQAETVLADMKRRGVVLDQVILTSLVHMYSKSGNLTLAEAVFEEMRLLGTPLDKRSYGSLIMAYIRFGLLEKGEDLLRESEEGDIYAGREVYKALLRAYSMAGDFEGTERVFRSSQLAGIVPDAKTCALIINAYMISGRSEEARLAFENLRRAGLEPNDKCVKLILAAYEKENRLNKALEFLMNLEKDGIEIGFEASELLVSWFRRLGVVEEVETVLRQFATDKNKFVQ